MNTSTNKNISIDNPSVVKSALKTFKILIMKNIFSFIILLLTLSVTGQNIYLHCGKLIDTKTGKVLTNKTIIVSGEKIISVEDGFTTSDNEKDILIDLKDKTVMPGLIDMHVHLEHESSAKRYIERYTLNDADVAFNSLRFAEATLLAGFTTVRDLGGSGVNISLRKAIASGKVDGPRIFTAGKSLARFTTATKQRSRGKFDTARSRNP